MGTMHRLVAIGGVAALIVVVAMTTVGVGCGPMVGCTVDTDEDDNGDGTDGNDDAEKRDDADTVEPIEDPPECETDDDEPLGLILSWKSDPTSTMTIDWHTDGEDSRRSLCVRRAEDEKWRYRVDAQREEIPYLDRYRYRVELTDLQPDFEYVFQVGQFEREFRFHTMPEDTEDRPVTFASGGDMRDESGGRHGWFVDTNERVMEFEPDFIVWGGDIAYGDGGEADDHEQLWLGLLDEQYDTLIDDDGRAVPIIAGIGNHEVRQGYKHRYGNDYEPTDEWREQESPYFYSLFVFPGHPGYNVLDFGEYLSVVMLDSRHNNPIDGEQTDWLESVLDERTDRGVDHILPFWHFTPYPNKTGYDRELPRLIRQNWAPLFEEYGIEVGFMHKDHAFLRTHPIRDGEIDEEDGIVYLGNGSWGASLNEWTTEADDWYADEFASIHHAYITTIAGDQIYSRAVDHDGEIYHGYGDEIQTDQ